MGIWEIVIGAFVLLMSIIMIIVIILQEGHDAGLGTITGGADSFMQRGKAKTADAMFARITKYCAIGFFILVVLLNALSYFGWTGKSNDKQNNVVIQSSEVSSDTEVSSVESSEGSTVDSSTDESSVADSSVDGSSESESSVADSSVDESSAVESSLVSSAE